MHPLGLVAVAVEKSRFPDQFVSEFVRSSRHPVIAGFPLARMGQLVTVTTGEDAAAVEDCYPPTTTADGTKELGAFPAKVAVGPIDGIACVLPVFTAATVAIGEDHPVRFGAHADGRHHLALAWPLTDEGLMRGGPALPFPAPHVDGSVVVGGGSPTSGPSATDTAHGVFLPNSFGKLTFLSRSLWALVGRGLGFL